MVSGGRSYMAANTIPELESSDRFLIQQVFKPIANEYRISVPAEGSRTRASRCSSSSRRR